jgi:hypothetical protein
MVSEITVTLPIAGFGTNIIEIKKVSYRKIIC